MTVSALTTRNDITATSGQATFTYTFMVLATTDMTVYQNGALLASGYTVTGVGSTTGGTVVLDTGALTGQIVSLVLAMPLDRTTDYQNSGDFLASDVNADFDKIYVGAIQNENWIDRGLRLQEVEPPTAGVDMTIPLKADRLGKFLGFNSSTGAPQAMTAGGTTALEVSYSPAGTGAVETNVQAKLRQYVGVQDFGAVGDGVTDDTAAIQAAITASNGVPILFNAGKTFLCDTFSVPSNAHLIINGTIKASLTVLDTPLITGANISNVIIEGTGNLDGGYNIAVGYQGRSATEPTTRTDGSALQAGDTFYDTDVGVKKFKQYSGSAWAIITISRTGIKLNKSTDCLIQGISVANFMLTESPGTDGAGIWLEGDPDGTSAVDSARNSCVNVTSYSNIGNGIVFGANLDSISDRCYAYDNFWGSGVAHTRGLRAKSINDFAENNAFSNITINCEESQIISPTSRGSGYSGINIGHDSAASDASRTLLVGGVTENNNFEGISVAGSSDVTIIGTYVNNNGANSGANDRYGVRTLSGCERLHLIGLKVTASKNSGIYLQSGSGHRIESCKSYANDRTGMLLTVTEANVSDCEVFNNNQLGGVNRAGIQLSSGNVSVTDSNIYDSQGSPTQSYGVLTNGGAHNLIGCSLSGNSISETSSPSGTISFYQTRVGSDSMTGTVPLSAGTSTVVTNNNAISASRIILIPRSAAAMALNAYSFNVVANTSFTINHFTAVGGEPINYIIM